MIRMRLLVFTCLVLAPGLALAWECTAHIGMTLLARVPGAPYSSAFTRDPYALCAEYRSDRSLHRSQRSPLSGCDEPDRFRDLIYAAQDPDEAGRPLFGMPGRNFFLGFSHLHEADKRAFDALRAAIAEYKSNRICGGEGAFSHLGRSLHYLQDFGDPSKDVDSIWFSKSRNNRKAGFRLLTAQLVFERAFYGDFPAPVKPPDWLLGQIADRFAALREPGEILWTLNEFRRLHAAEARQRYHAIRAGEQTEEYRAYFDRQMADIAIRSVVAIQAAQTRWTGYWSAMIAAAPLPDPQPVADSCLRNLPSSRDEAAWCALGRCLAGQGRTGRAEADYAMGEAEKFWMAHALRRGLARQSCPR